MTLLETLALLTFVLTLLSLIVDVIRLTVEVMAKFSQKKDDDNKKRLTAPVTSRAVNLLTSRMESWPNAVSAPSVCSIVIFSGFVKQDHFSLVRQPRT